MPRYSKLASKKSIAFYWIAILILILALLIIFLIFGKKIFLVLGAKTEEDVCGASVFANSLPGLKLNIKEFVTAINCPIIIKTIKQKKKNEIMLSLAKHMAKCWNMWQEGKKKLYEGTGKLCAICYTLNFEKEMKISKDDFINFLNTTKIENSLKPISYLEFFETVGLPEEIDTAKKYSIAYTHFQNDLFQTNLVLDESENIEMKLIGCDAMPVQKV